MDGIDKKYWVESGFKPRNADSIIFLFAEYKSVYRILLIIQHK